MVAPADLGCVQPPALPRSAYPPPRGPWSYSPKSVPFFHVVINDRTFPWHLTQKGMPSWSRSLFESSNVLHSWHRRQILCQVLPTAFTYEERFNWIGERMCCDIVHLLSKINSVGTFRADRRLNIPFACWWYCRCFRRINRYRTPKGNTIPCSCGHLRRCVNAFIAQEVERCRCSITTPSKVRASRRWDWGVFSFRLEWSNIRESTGGVWWPVCWAVGKLRYRRVRPCRRWLSQRCNLISCLFLFKQRVGLSAQSGRLVFLDFVKIGARILGKGGWSRTIERMGRFQSRKLDRGNARWSNGGGHARQWRRNTVQTIRSSWRRWRYWWGRCFPNREIGLAKIARAEVPCVA